MNGADTLAETVMAWGSAGPPAGSIGVARTRRAACGTADGHLAAVRELREPGGDDAIFRLEAIGDHHLTLVLLGDRDGTHRHGAVRLQQIDEGPVGTALHRRGGHY